MEKKYRQLLFFVCVLVALFAIVRYTNLHKHLSLTAIKSENHFLKQLMEHNYYTALITFIGIFALVIGIGIPGSAALTLLSGYLFGMVKGGLCALIGSLLGAIISFLLFRYVLRDAVTKWYGTRIEQFKIQMSMHGISYLLMLHFMTVVPYFVINALAALSDISLLTFVWATIIGSIPIISVYAFAGRQLGYIQSVGDIFSPAIIIAFVLLIVLACMPIILKRLKSIEM